MLTYQEGLKKMIKDIIVRAAGLLMATFFGGTAIGAMAGDWLLGSLIGVGSAFAIVITMIGVSMAWTGLLSDQAITNAFRAAVAKAAEDNENIKDALAVEEDGEFEFDDFIDLDEADR